MAELHFLDVAGWPRPVSEQDQSPGKLTIAEAAKHWSCKRTPLRKLWVATMSPKSAKGVSWPDVARTVREEQSLLMLKAAKFPRLSDEDFERVVEECRQRGLNPWCDQVYAKHYHNPQTGLPEVKLVLTIAGLRALAAMTGEYVGRGAPRWRSLGGPWEKTWDATEPPAEAKVMVRRKGADLTPGYALWEAVAPFTEYGGQKEYAAFWQTMGPKMLAKCAEADGLRAAYPEIGGLYLVEEMQQAEDRWFHGRGAARRRGDGSSRAAAASPAEAPAPSTLTALLMDLGRAGIHSASQQWRFIDSLKPANPWWPKDKRRFWNLVRAEAFRKAGEFALVSEAV